MDSFHGAAGEISARVTPVTRLSKLTVTDRGARRGGFAEAYVAAIPLHVASRELEIVGKMLNWPAEQLHVRGLSNDLGPGNALTITIEHEAVTEVFTGFGGKGVSAENCRQGRRGACARLPGGAGGGRPAFGGSIAFAHGARRRR